MREYLPVSEGSLTQLLTKNREQLAVFTWLAQHYPDKTVFQHDLSVSYNNVGDVQNAQGDLTGALSSYRQSLVIAERLSRQDPGNADWQRDLSLSYVRIAAVMEHDRNPGAGRWWRRAYETLSGMKKSGMELSPNDEAALDQLRQKIE